MRSILNLKFEFHEVKRARKQFMSNYLLTQYSCETGENVSRDIRMFYLNLDFN